MKNRFCAVLIFFIAALLAGQAFLAQAAMDWTQATGAAAFHEREGHASVVFNNKMWVIGGHYGTSTQTYLNDVWSSSDGVNWTEETPAAAFSSRAFHSCVVFNNKMWIIGGISSSPKNDVWSSADGITWTTVTAHAQFAPRGYHNTLVYNSKLWVSGGMTLSGTYYFDTWSSDDGITWTRASASFGSRAGASSLVFNNKMWFIGGYQTVFSNGSIIYKHDVFSSTDGANWIQETAAAAFPARAGHSSVVYNNEMWVCGGFDDTSAKNDCWSSPDGVNWTQATGVAFPARRGHASVVHSVVNPGIWVIGGSDLSNQKNDVWYAPPSTVPVELSSFSIE